MDLVFCAFDLVHLLAVAELPLSLLSSEGGVEGATLDRSPVYVVVILDHSHLILEDVDLHQGFFDGCGARG